jgi:cell division protein FtsL
VTQTTVPTFTPKKATKFSIPNLFTTKWIGANMFFILYLSILAIAYIAYGHWTDRTLRTTNTVENQIKELQYEYKTMKTQVMHLSEEGEVLKAASPLGLHISYDVPKRLKP